MQVCEAQRKPWIRRIRFPQGHWMREAPAQAQEEQAEARASWMRRRRRPAGMARREGACAARGLKKQMVGMASDNAKVSLDEKFRLIERDEERTSVAAANLGEVIGLQSLNRIEAFDNSNIQGTNPVSAMVVFTNGKPDKKEYRKYKIRTVLGPDDYDTMREVIRRRYERVLKENLPLPDLIVVDGGKGQISAAIDVLENELGLFIPVCGLVKDAKHKTAHSWSETRRSRLRFPGQPGVLFARIQDEVHRFAISFHREQRGKSMVSSKLDSIPGIGEKRRKRC